MNFLNTFQLTCGLHDIANSKNNKSSNIYRMGNFSNF